MNRAAFQEVDTPVRCANLDCPNQPHEGRFKMIETTEPLVGNGVRKVRLWLCAPCADTVLALGFVL